MIGIGLLDGIGSSFGSATALRHLHGWMMPDVVTTVLYHGLVDAQLPVPSAMFLPIRQFERQMEYLARHFTVLHVEEALDPDRPPGRRPVAAVTFDDGFASLHELALPILDRLGIPATVYLVTDLVDTEGALWYTRLHRALCETSVREARLGGLHLPLRNVADRMAASERLQEVLKELPRERFAPALEELVRTLGEGARGEGKPWRPGRILRSAQIREMSRRDRVRFGAHTATHQILTRTDIADVRSELGRSTRAVAALVERPSRSFAYPNGGPEDFDDAVIAELRATGVDYAMTTIEGPNRRGADPYRLRRYPVSATEHPARFTRQVHHTRAILEGLLGSGDDAGGASGGRGGAQGGGEQERRRRRSGRGIS